MATPSTPATVPAAGSSHFKSKHLIDTDTSELQEETELECEPFFVNIASLPPSETNHLRGVGLLASSKNTKNNNFTNNSTSDNDGDDPNSTKTEINTNIQLLRNNHASYLSRTLYPKDVYPLPSSFLSLDASKPWMLYWTIHALDLLHELQDNSIQTDAKFVSVVHTLESCWSENKQGGGGGFGGGPSQLPHCATSYAAVHTLCILAGLDKELYPDTTLLALDLLKRKRKDLATWFHTLRVEQTEGIISSSTAAADDDDDDDDDGEERVVPCGYRMHHDGEVDVRATYTICTMASLLNTLTPSLTNGVVDYVVSCQTFEGGFGGEPYSEAHGGYTLCALGALHILTKGDLMSSGLDIPTLRGWLSRRQMGFEGGFQGRCNKLVDGCYSYWIGGSIAILDLGKSSDYKGMPGGGVGGLSFDSGVFCGTETSDDQYKVLRSLSDVGDEIEPEGGLTFDQSLLQRYILLCAQDVNGGLRDKPSKGRDFYHSCYNLSGLSISQHVLTTCGKEDGRLNVFQYEDEKQNIVGPTHPIYNVRVERLQAILNVFQN